MKYKGYLCGIFASFTWGTVFVVGRFILDNGNVSPFIIAFWRCFFGSIFLFFILLRKIKDVLSIPIRDLLYLFALSFIGIFLFNTLLFYSLIYTTATSSSILMNANPLFILILATLFLREKISSGKVLGVIIGFLGCTMVIQGTGVVSTVGINPLKGNILALGSALCWALYTVLGGYSAKKYGAVLTTFIILLTGMFLFLIVMLVMKINFWNIGLPVFLSGAYLGIVPAGIGFTLWYNALKYLEAGELGIFQYFASVVTAVLSIIFLKESLNILIISGMVLVCLSFYIPKIKKFYSARI
ncbi:MAG: DMT family transporter [Candidatus Omnitrophica bacterium]|nr:DMT family transporter [Candidatus Omnitrophota bacterium]MCM8776753.1 DMT family transporter [Candidatus Omnitrophota bacterium]